MKRVYLLAGFLAVLVASFASADIPPIMPPPVTGLPLSVDSLTITGSSGIMSAGQVTASSITSQGAFSAAGSTLTVASSGIVSAPRQPAFRATFATTQNIGTGAWTPLYLGTEDYNRNFLHDVSGSSNTFTVPAGGGGLYSLKCYATFRTSATGQRYIRITTGGGATNNGTVIAQGLTGVGTSVLTTSDVVLAAGESISCQVYQDSGGDLLIDGTVNYTAFSAVKLW